MLDVCKHTCVQHLQRKLGVRTRIGKVHVWVSLRDVPKNGASHWLNIAWMHGATSSNVRGVCSATSSSIDDAGAMGMRGARRRAGACEVIVSGGTIGIGFVCAP